MAAQKRSSSAVLIPGRGLGNGFPWLALSFAGQPLKVVLPWETLEPSGARTVPQSVVLQVVVVVQVPDVVAVLPDVVVLLVPLVVVTVGSEHTVSVVTVVPVLSGGVVSAPGSVASVVCAYNIPALKNVTNRRYFKRYLGNLIIGASERSVLALRKWF